MRRSLSHNTAVQSTSYATKHANEPVKGGTSAVSAASAVAHPSAVPTERTTEMPSGTAFAAMSSRADLTGGTEAGPDPILQAAVGQAGHGPQELDWDVVEVRNYVVLS